MEGTDHLRTRTIFLLIVILLFNLVICSSVLALDKKTLSTDEVFGMLDRAFNAQVSLSEQYRTYEEAEKVLKPYFSDEFINLFLQENLNEDELGFIVYGTDMPIYYIPFYSYSDKTDVTYNSVEDKIYVHEFFQGDTLGPVSYEDHYETVILKRIGDKWIIDDIVISTEKPKIATDKREVKQTAFKNGKKENKINTQVEAKVAAEKTEVIKNKEYTPIHKLYGMSYREQLYSGALKGTY